MAKPVKEPERNEAGETLEDVVTRLWIEVAKGMMDRAPPADGRRLGDTLVIRLPTRDKRGYRA
jgi:hypothetical protein